MIMLSLKIALFSPSLCVCLLFHFLPYFIRTFNMMLKRKGGGDILALCLILTGSFMFLIIKYDISNRFYIDILFPGEEVILCS